MIKKKFGKIYGQKESLSFFDDQKHEFALTSLPLFMLSFFEVPKDVQKKIDYFRSRFFLAK
jgi:hypothetical protein